MGMRKGAAALTWNRDKDDAPRLIAAGKGYLADRILTLAEKAEIPIIEQEPLTQVLITMDPGKEIPPELFELTAEIYIFLMKLDGEFNGYSRPESNRETS